jgi:uncharacterized membrane protein
MIPEPIRTEGEATMIRTPPGWGADMLTQAFHSVTGGRPGPATRSAETITVRRIEMADLRWALGRGLEDFGASRTDVIFLCVIYPLLGLLLARVASGYDMLPLVFPLTSGFALLGPLAAVGLNEMSRRREMGEPAGLGAAFGVFRSPAIGGIVLLGGLLITIFIFWLVIANTVYNLTLGPEPPASLGSFVHDIFHTSAGWAMAVIGIGLGFLLAVGALVISVVSFPMLLDQNVPLETAVRTSARVVMRNPVVMAAWGLIVAAALVLGSIPLLLGLIVVMPVLGHATWHLYRLAVAN